jgi:sugar phosphate isomerase/epimerase
MVTRRHFGQLALATLALPMLAGRRGEAATGVNSTYKGVKLGLITGTLNPLPDPLEGDPIDFIIRECLEVGAANIELVNVMGLKPPAVVNGGRFGQVPDVITPEYTESREALRKWRIAEPLERYHEVRQKFAQAGLNLFSYVWTVADDDSEEEIDAGFRKLKALGVQIFTTNQSRVGVGPRLAPFAANYGISPSWHPHDKSDDPREVASAESLEQLLAMSKHFKVNLDIGHYTAGNQDAVAFLARHHERISHLHIKDRKRDHGPNVQLGTGDTPIATCLKLVRDHKWPIYAILEREYRGPGTPVEETKWQMNYMREALDT